MPENLLSSATSKISALAAASMMFLVGVVPADAADNLAIERLATCRDSWIDWKQNNPAQLKKFADDFQSQFFLRKETDPFLVPKSSQTVAGLPVAEVYPESVGMGVGFSVKVNASFDKTKATLEKKLGQLLKQCERGDNMRTCALQLAEKKTIMLVAEDNPQSTTALFGCYYFYEK